MKKLYLLLITLFIAGWFNSINPQDILSRDSSHSVELKQNFPNPFNPSTQIEYYLPYRTYIEINIYNILGIKFQTLIQTEQEKGWYKVEFNAEDLPAGLYVYEILTPLFKQMRKMIYVK